MRLFRFMTALGLLYCLLPGAGEIVENTARLLRHGHPAHAVGADHSHPAGDPEHGCTTTVHFCSCHSSVSFLPPAPSHLTPPHTQPRPSEPTLSRPGSDALAAVFRPPRLT